MPPPCCRQGVALQQRGCAERRHGSVGRAPRPRRADEVAHTRPAPMAGSGTADARRRGLARSAGPAAAAFHQRNAAGERGAPPGDRGAHTASLNRRGHEIGRGRGHAAHAVDTQALFNRLVGKARQYQKPPCALTCTGRMCSAGCAPTDIRSQPLAPAPRTTRSSQGARCSRRGVSIATAPSSCSTSASWAGGSSARSFASSVARSAPKGASAKRAMDSSASSSRKLSRALSCGGAIV